MGNLRHSPGAARVPVCDNCGQHAFHGGWQSTGFHHQFLCAACHAAGIHTCLECGGCFSPSTPEIVRCSLCMDCAREGCSGCGRERRQASLFRVSTTNARYCYDCISTQFRRCRGCGNWVFCPNDAVGPAQCPRCQWPEIRRIMRLEQPAAVPHRQPAEGESCRICHQSHFELTEVEIAGGDAAYCCSRCLPVYCFRCDFCGRLRWGFGRSVLGGEACCTCRSVIEARANTVRPEAIEGQFFSIPAVPETSCATVPPPPPPPPPSPSRNNGKLLPWSHKPQPIFSGVSPNGAKGPIAYGLEWETDDYATRPYAIKHLRALPFQKDYYLKADGSLSNGIEIVFHPRGINSWIRYAKKLQQMAEIIKKNGGHSHSPPTCGIHIHRGHADLNAMDLLKVFTVFVALETPIYHLSGRGDNTSYCSFDTTRELGANAKGEWDGKRFYQYAKNGQLFDDRGALAYCENTLEFRVFQGTLEVETILNYIIFCDSFVAFTKKLQIIQVFTLSPKELWTLYKEYLEKEKRGRLLDYLEEREKCFARKKL